MKVISGHQPIADFHTGLIAKVWATGKRRVFFLHDLDALAEKGSKGIRVPKPRGRNTDLVRLIAPKLDKRQLFTAGPVQICGLGLLGERLITLADGKVRGFKSEFKNRLEEFATYFPEGTRFESVAELNVSILRFVLPRIGVAIPRLEMLSDWMNTSEWKVAALGLLDCLSDFLRVYSQVGGRNCDQLPFWGWDVLEQNRFRISSAGEARELAANGWLIPKAPALIWILRVGLGLKMIRGLGGANYEKSIERAASELGRKIASTRTISSRQGVPEPWQGLVRDTNFRPSALLLWLMGGEFVPPSALRRLWYHWRYD